MLAPPLSRPPSWHRTKRPRHCVEAKCLFVGCVAKPASCLGCSRCAVKQRGQRWGRESDSCSGGRVCCWVFEKLNAPWFVATDDGVGSDGNFCALPSGKGFGIFVDVATIAGHVGAQAVDQEYLTTPRLEVQR